MGYNVAIDGPAGAGKSTIAKRVAKEKGYIYVDTGAMYRALAVYFLDKKINPENLDAIAAACEGAEVKIQYEQGEQQVYLNGENITSRLRNEEVGNMASKVSAVPEVRAHLLNLQKELARYKELEEKGVSCDLEEIKKDIKERDERDCTRKIAPLRQAEDAVLIDSSDMTIEEVVKAITDNIV